MDIQENNQKNKKNNPIKFPREEIIRSKEFKEYHQDILRALLPESHYTKEEARNAIFKYFKKGGK